MTNITIRINAMDKKNFKRFCESIDMDVSTVINIFIKNILRESKLPFEVEPFYNEINMNYINSQIEEVESGKAKFIEHDLIEN